MDTEAERGQGTRAQQEGARRRRRGDETLAATKRLPIPPEVKERLDREGLVPRWVNDQGNRMHRFTVQDDYDLVEGVEPVPVGTDEAGNPIKAHLVAKRADFINEDKANAEKRRKEVEQSLFRRPDAADAAGAGQNPHKPVSERYIAPESKVGRGNQILDS